MLDAALVLSLRVEEKTAGRGVLRTGVFTAIRNGEAICSLESSRYLPGEKGGEENG